MRNSRGTHWPSQPPAAIRLPAARNPIVAAMVSVAILTAIAGAAPPPPKVNKSAGPTAIHVPFWPEQAREASKEALTATLNGKPTPIAKLLSPDDDLLLLTVLDLTGDLSLADPAREALIEQWNRLPANVEVGVMRAQDGLSVIADPGSAPDKLAEAIRAVPVNGFAGLLDTVETTVNLADGILRKANVRVAVLYVTDSSIQNYRADYTNPVVNSSDSRDMSRRFPEGLVKEQIGKILGKLARTQAPLFIVHLAYRNDRLNEAYQTGLIDIAAATGGATQYCRTPADVPGAIGGAMARILAHQSAEIQLPAKAGSGPLEVILSAKGLVLRHRTRFELEKR
ncbi:MAG: hypothetical protein R2762_15005 [Bryobacteraceae bacterium]